MLTVAQCKRALRQGCRSFLVMVNTATASFLGVSPGTATVTSVTNNSSPPCVLHRPLPLHPALLIHCHGSLIPSGLTLLICLLSHLGCHPIEVLIIPLEPGTQPPLKRMYRLSPSELQDVKRQVTEQPA